MWTEKVKKVHKDLLKKFQWVSDKSRLGVLEHWDRPKVLKNGILKGDCDDFMLEGYYRCLDEGVPKENLKLCVCLTRVGTRDNVSYDHAILIYIDERGKYWGFDNRYPKLYHLFSSEYSNIYVPSSDDISKEWILITQLPKK